MITHSNAIAKTIANLVINQAEVFKTGHLNRQQYSYTNFKIHFENFKSFLVLKVLVASLGGKNVIIICQFVKPKLQSKRIL